MRRISYYVDIPFPQKRLSTFLRLLMFSVSMGVGAYRDGGDASPLVFAASPPLGGDAGSSGPKVPKAKEEDVEWKSFVCPSIYWMKLGVASLHW